MANVQFYHLTATPLERALPKLLEKALGAGFRALLVASEERLERLNDLLWTYDPDSFLPHGSAKDGNVEAQPILLASSIEPKNGAKLLVVTDGATLGESDQFERVLDMFDGNDAEATEKARQRWTLYKNAGHSVTYMQQTASGGWEQKVASNG